MYIPKHFEETRIEVLHQLIKSCSLGTLVNQDDGEIEANHIPFLISQSGDRLGTLKCHIAKSNPVWKSLCSEETLVIFQGPNCYISPSWYPSKHIHGKAVPTWDYVVVHARGVPEVINDSEWLFEHLSTMTGAHESKSAVPWKVADAPAEYIDRMVSAIVGIEIPITRLTGKWKVSQNRTKSDQAGVIAGLESENTQNTKAISRIIQEIGS
jgi:transcriptional regulator